MSERCHEIAKSTKPKRRCKNKTVGQTKFCRTHRKSSSTAPSFPPPPADEEAVPPSLFITKCMEESDKIAKKIAKLVLGLNTSKNTLNIIYDSLKQNKGLQAQDHDASGAMNTALDEINQILTVLEDTFKKASVLKK
jgi:hypothetical protein